MVPHKAMARRLSHVGVELRLPRLDFDHLKLCVENSGWSTIMDEAYDDTMAFLADTPKLDE